MATSHYPSYHQSPSRYRLSEQEDDDISYVTSRTVATSSSSYYNPTRLLPNRNHEAAPPEDDPFSRSSTPIRSSTPPVRSSSPHHPTTSSRSSSPYVSSSSNNNISHYHSSTYSPSHQRQNVASDMSVDSTMTMPRSNSRSRIATADFVDLTDYDATTGASRIGYGSGSNGKQQTKDDVFYLLEDRRYSHPAIQSKHEKQQVFDDRIGDHHYYHRTTHRPYHQQLLQQEEKDSAIIYESEDRLSRMRRESELVDLSSVTDGVNSTPGYLHYIDLTQVPTFLDDQTSVTSIERDWDVIQNQSSDHHHPDIHNSDNNSTNWEVQSLPQQYGRNNENHASTYSPMSLPPNLSHQRTTATYAELPAVTDDATTVVAKPTSPYGLTQKTAIDLVIPTLKEEEEEIASTTAAAAGGGSSTLLLQNPVAQTLPPSTRDVTYSRIETMTQELKSEIAYRNRSHLQASSCADPPGALEFQPSLISVPEDRNQPLIVDPPGYLQQSHKKNGLSSHLQPPGTAIRCNSLESEELLVDHHHHSSSGTAVVKPHKKSDAPTDDVLFGGASSSRQQDCPAIILRQLSNPAAPSSPASDVYLSKTYQKFPNMLPIDVTQLNDESATSRDLGTEQQEHLYIQHHQPSTAKPASTNAAVFTDKGGYQYQEIIVIDSGLMESPSSGSSNGRESRDPTEKASNLTTARTQRPHHDPIEVLPQSPPETQRTIRATPSDPIRTWMPSQGNIDSVMRGMVQQQQQQQQQPQLHHHPLPPSPPAATTSNTRGIQLEEEESEESAAESLLSHLLDDSICAQSIPSDRVVMECDGIRSGDMLNITSKDQEDNAAATNKDHHGTSMKQQSNPDPVAALITGEEGKDENSSSSSSSFGGAEANSASHPIPVFAPKQSSFELNRQDTLSSGEVYCDDEPVVVKDSPSFPEQKASKQPVTIELQESITNDMEDTEGEEEVEDEQLMISISQEQAAFQHSGQDLDAEATYAAFCLSDTEKDGESEHEARQQDVVEESIYSKLGSLQSLWEDRFKWKTNNESEYRDEENDPSEYDGTAKGDLSQNQGNSRGIDILDESALAGAGAKESTEKEVLEAHADAEAEAEVIMAEEEFLDMPTREPSEAEADPDPDHEAASDSEPEVVLDESFLGTDVEATLSAQKTSSTKRVSFKADIEEVNFYHPFPEPCPVENTVHAVADVWSTKMAGIADIQSSYEGRSMVGTADTHSSSKGKSMHSMTDTQPSSKSKSRKSSKSGKSRKEKLEKSKLILASSASASTINAVADVWSTKMAGIADKKPLQEQSTQEEKEPVLADTLANTVSDLRKSPVEGKGNTEPSAKRGNGAIEDKPRHEKSALVNTAINVVANMWKMTSETETKPKPIKEERQRPERDTKTGTEDMPLNAVADDTGNTNTAGDEETKKVWSTKQAETPGPDTKAVQLEVVQQEQEQEREISAEKISVEVDTAVNRVADNDAKTPTVPEVQQVDPLLQNVMQENTEETEKSEEQTTSSSLIDTDADKRVTQMTEAIYDVGSEEDEEKKDEDEEERKSTRPPERELPIGEEDLDDDMDHYIGEVEETPVVVVSGEGKIAQAAGSELKISNEGPTSDGEQHEQEDESVVVVSVDEACAPMVEDTDKEDRQKEEKTSPFDAFADVWNTKMSEKASAGDSQLTNSTKKKEKGIKESTSTNHVNIISTPHHSHLLVTPTTSIDTQEIGYGNKLSPGVETKKGTLIDTTTTPDEKECADSNVLVVSSDQILQGTGSEQENAFTQMPKLSNSMKSSVTQAATTSPEEVNTAGDGDALETSARGDPLGTSTSSWSFRPDISSFISDLKSSALSTLQTEKLAPGKELPLEACASEDFEPLSFHDGGSGTLKLPIGCSNVVHDDSKESAIGDSREIIGQVPFQEEEDVSELGSEDQWVNKVSVSTGVAVTAEAISALRKDVKENNTGSFHGKLGDSEEHHLVSILAVQDSASSDSTEDGIEGVVSEDAESEILIQSPTLSNRMEDAEAAEDAECEEDTEYTESNQEDTQTDADSLEDTETEDAEFHQENTQTEDMESNPEDTQTKDAESPPEDTNTKDVECNPEETQPEHAESEQEDTLIEDVDSTPKETQTEDEEYQQEDTRTDEMESSPKDAQAEDAESHQGCDQAGIMDPDPEDAQAEDEGSQQGYVQAEDAGSQQGYTQAEVVDPNPKETQTEDTESPQESTEPEVVESSQHNTQLKDVESSLIVEESTFGDLSLMMKDSTSGDLVGESLIVMPDDNHQKTEAADMNTEDCPPTAQEPTKEEAAVIASIMKEEDIPDVQLADSLINLSFDNDTSTVSALNDSADSPEEAPGATLDMECLQVLVTSLMTHEYGFEFSTPIDLNRFPNYDEATSKYKPLDLGTILRNLINGDYETILEFQSDVNMAFTFRMKHSKKGTKVYKAAKTLKKKFEKDLLKLLDDLENKLTG